MTVKQFLDQNKPEKYVLTDRMRAPFTEEQIKWLNLAEIEVRNTDTINGDTVRIQTDYMPDTC